MALNSTPDIFSVMIDKVGAQGDGVGMYENMPVYVPMTVAGDAVTVRVKERKKSGIDAELVSIDKPSKNRREPPCKHFGECGGCQLQHLDNDFYAAWGRERLLFALKQHGFEDIHVKEPVISSVYSRRRVAFKALKTIDGLIIGFSQKHSHRIIDIQECYIASGAIMALLPDLRRLLIDVLPQKGLATLHITEASNGLDVLIDCSLELDLNARERLVSFADQHDIAALHWQNNSFLDPVAIRRAPTMSLGGVDVPLPSAGFIQATAEGEVALVSAVTAACDGFARVADLFCGLGTFTFPLAANHQVLAVEGAKTAIESLEAGRNAAQRTGPKLKQIVTRHRDLFRRPLTADEFSGFDAVVIDPPRAGALTQMQQLANSGVKRVVSVSCNPNTFARDARILAEGGFTLERILPVDQFLWSSHMELVGVFTKQ